MLGQSQVRQCCFVLQLEMGDAHEGLCAHDFKILASAIVA